MAYRGKGSWTEEELHLLRSKYPSHGPVRVARILNRQPQSVKGKAHQLGIRLGDIPGWVPLGAVSDVTGLAINSVKDRAERAGVLRRITSHKNSRVVLSLVPESWADAYVRYVERGREAEELRDYYYDLQKTARIFGVTGVTIRRWLYGEYPNSYGAQVMSRVKFVMTTGLEKRSYLFEPLSVEREAKTYRERKKGNS